MIIINREMQKDEKESLYYGKCQASINSDGNITLRNYNLEDKNKDQILILTYNETRALIDLFKLLIQKDLLPF